MVEIKFCETVPFLDEEVDLPKAVNGIHTGLLDKNVYVIQMITSALLGSS